MGCWIPETGVGATQCWRNPCFSEGSDLRLPEGLLHLLQEFQLVLCLFQVAIQDLAPDDPWARDRMSVSSRH